MSDSLRLLACTVCDGATGQQVRATIFADDFWATLASVAAPFPILLLGLAAFHFGFPPFQSRRVGDGPLR